MFTFQKQYFFWFTAILVIELLIGFFVNDTIIRPYIGDLLVVILLYCLLKTFFNIPVGKAVLLVLLFSFTVELLQYLNVVKLLGLQHSRVARIIIGTSFSWIDMLMYVLGTGLTLVIEKYFDRASIA